MSLIRHWRRSVLIVLALAGLAALAGVLIPGSASAQSTGSCGSVPGRACDYGWFYNRYTDGDDDDDNLFEDGLYADDIEELVGMIRGHIRCQSPGTPSGRFSTPQDDREATGAAFIVLTILGAQPGTAKNQACVRWNEWEARVRDYDRQGLIHYNELHDVDVNGGYDFDHSDVVRYREDAAEDAIVIYDTNGNVIHAIQRFCGNPLNRQQPLPPLNPTPTPPTPTPPPGPPSTPAGSATIVNCEQVSGTATNPAAPGTSVPITVRFSNGSQATTNTDATTGQFSILTPQAVKQDPTSVTVSIFAGSGASQSQLSGSPRTMAPCMNVAADCGAYDVTPSVPDPGEGYNIVVNVNYGDPSQANVVNSRSPRPRFYVTVNGPNVNYRDDNVPFSVAGSSLRASVNRPPTGATGTYRITWGIVSDAGAVDCAGGTSSNPPPVTPEPPVTFPVANKPYFRVNGGDISAGVGMSKGQTDCAVAADDKAGIVSWNRGPGNGYAGAGTQFAAFIGSREGRLQEFATAAGSGLAPSGLSFANSNPPNGLVDVNAGHYGGRFQGGNCVPDHFADATNILPAGTVINGRAIANGSRATIYVRGDAYIRGDITFSGSYASVSDVPDFQVIAEGNIYVDPAVNRLDGVYIAQPSTATSTDGNIYTCATAPVSSADLDQNLHNRCNRPLTVNGAFSARQVWLMRTAGSVSGTAAETFNYLPELWLPAVYGAQTGATTDGYDAITSLPPVL